MWRLWAKTPGAALAVGRLLVELRSVKRTRTTSKSLWNKFHVWLMREISALWKWLTSAFAYQEHHSHTLQAEGLFCSPFLFTDVPHIRCICAFHILTAFRWEPEARRTGDCLKTPCNRAKPRHGFCCPVSKFQELVSNYSALYQAKLQFKVHHPLWNTNSLNLYWSKRLDSHLVAVIITVVSSRKCFDKVQNHVRCSKGRIIFKENVFFRSLAFLHV